MGFRFPQINLPEISIPKIPEISLPPLPFDVPINLPHIGSTTQIANTLEQAVTKPSLETIAPVIKGAILFNPVGLASTIAYENRGEIKTSLSNVGNTIKENAIEAKDNVKEGIITVKDKLGDIGTSMMMPIGLGILALVIVKMIITNGK
jgi:hypothetical protein